MKVMFVAVNGPAPEEEGGGYWWREELRREGVVAVDKDERSRFSAFDDGYNNATPERDASQTQDEMPADETEGGKFMEPLKHSVFAEKSDISKPKSLLIAKLFAVGKQRGTAPVTSPILTALAYAYENTPPKSRCGSALVSRASEDYDADFAQFRQEYIEAALAQSFHGDMPEEYKGKEPGQEQ
ncbi:MAG: hypothetical protein Q9175_006640 [Cornicularia normoerica]